MNIRRVALPIVVLLSACIAVVSIEANPQDSGTASRSEAFVVLTGFGYGGDGERALKALGPAIAAEGMDLHVPSYISRSGLSASRRNLQRYIQERLTRYDRLHVFAFLAGGWTFNPLAELGAVRGLATVIYDRSPLQERAPRIADERLHFLTWVRYGSPVFDLARAPYPPLTSPSAKVGLIVETSPTSFIRQHERAARSYGAFQFECEALGQRHDDCAYVDLNHDEMYERFAEVWPEVRAFIRTGKFSTAANRTPPIDDPFAKRVRQ